MRKAISALVVFCVLAAVPAFEVSGASIAISRLSKKTAGPFDVIKIYGAGFTAASDMRVIFANGAYVVTVPAICGTKTTLEVGVPFFFDTKTGAIKSGVVKVTVKSKSLGIKSNTLTGFKITDLPRTTQAPGTVTLAFLEDLKTLTGCADGQLEFLQKASKGKVNTVKARANVSKMGTNLGALQTALTTIQKGQRINRGSSVKINKASLAASDRLILGYLAQLDAVAEAALKAGATVSSEPDWVPPDGLSIPGLSEIYGKLASYAEEKGFNEQKLWEFLKRNEAVVATTCQVLVFAAPALGLPAVGAAAGGFALVYSCGIAAYTISEYAAFYLGLPSGVTEADGFWPLLKSILDSSLAIYGFRLPDVCKLKALIDIYGQGTADHDLIKRLVEPVKEAAPAIIPQLLMITVEGSWGGTLHFISEGNDNPLSFTAKFTESSSGLTFSGEIQTGGSTDAYKRDVSGTINGYIISFYHNESGTVGGTSWIEKWNFRGSLSADGKTIGGKHDYYCKYWGAYNDTITASGDWILSR